MGFIVLGGITCLLEKRAKAVKAAREFGAKEPVEA